MGKKRNIGGFEDTELEWNEFSQRRGKDFGQIVFTEEKEHWIFVDRKCGSDVNICDLLRNNGKLDYPENKVGVICRVACCLQVQQQNNSIDCGVFGIAFAVDVCFGLPPNQSCYDVLKCATTCKRVCNYKNYQLFRRFQRGFHVADFFNNTLIFLCMPKKLFYERCKR